MLVGNGQSLSCRPKNLTARMQFKRFIVFWASVGVYRADLTSLCECISCRSRCASQHHLKSATAWRIIIFCRRGVPTDFCKANAKCGDAHELFDRVPACRITISTNQTGAGKIQGQAHRPYTIHAPQPLCFSRCKDNSTPRKRVDQLALLALKIDHTKALAKVCRMNNMQRYPNLLLYARDKSAAYPKFKTDVKLPWIKKSWLRC